MYPTANRRWGAYAFMPPEQRPAVAMTMRSLIVALSGRTMKYVKRPLQSAAGIRTMAVNSVLFRAGFTRYRAWWMNW